MRGRGGGGRRRHGSRGRDEAAACTARTPARAVELRDRSPAGEGHCEGHGGGCWGGCGGSWLEDDVDGVFSTVVSIS